MTETAEIPARIEDCEVRLLSYDPLVGVLILATSEGEIELAINKSVAVLLSFALTDFLGAEAETEPERLD